MQLVSTVTVGSGGAASIEFTSIPQTGTDLLLVVSARTDFGNVTDFSDIRFNNNSSSIYSHRALFGDGSSASSASGSGSSSYQRDRVNAGTSTSNTFSQQAIYIPNYAGSSAKSFSIDSVTENNATTSYQYIVAGLFNSTDAITSIRYTTAFSANYVAGSTASLYIITKA
jgi:hypothetical protein